LGFQGGFLEGGAHGFGRAHLGRADVELHHEWRLAVTGLEGCAPDDGGNAVGGGLAGRQWRGGRARAKTSGARRAAVSSTRTSRPIIEPICGIARSSQPPARASATSAFSETLSMQTLSGRLRTRDACARRARWAANRSRVKSPVAASIRPELRARSSDCRTATPLR
jgi:hypothetical protein